MAAINNQENKNIKDESQVKEYSFARYISDLRQKRNLTQKALAEKIQVSDRTISKWENGFTVPDLHNIRNICKELGVSANSVVLEKNTISDYFHNFIRFLIKMKKHIFNNVIKIIIAILFVLLLIYFINNYNAVSIYILNYDSNDITIGNGYFIKSKVRNILLIDNIELNENISYKNLNLELYTLVNSDKVVLYESDELEDIFLEELSGYPDALINDVIRAITKNIYLVITTYDENNIPTTYECTISFKKNFSNNKFIYSNYIRNNDYNIDYQMFLNPDSVPLNTYNSFKNNKFVNNSYLSSINEKDINDNSIATEDENKLKDLGYTYDKNSETYTKIDDNKTITYKLEFDLLIIKKEIANVEYNTYYYIAKDRILFYGYLKDNLNDPLVNFKYLTNSNYLYCVIGNCENYQSEIDYILTEYQTISSIL